MLSHGYLLESDKETALGKEKATMRQSLKINVSKAPRPVGAVTCRTYSLRERIMRFLFGGKLRVTILIPGDNVDEVTICDLKKGETHDGQSKDDLRSDAACSSGCRGHAKTI